MLFACTAPGSLLAQTATRVAVTDTLILEGRADNQNGSDDDDNYGAITNRLNLSANAGELRLTSRIDVFGFVKAPNDRYRSLASLERLSAAWGRAGFTVELGDFYRQLGRGISLSLRKIDEAGVDVALRGGVLGYQNDIFGLSAFGGLTNPVNVDGVNQQAVRDTHDIVAGGEVSVRPLSRLQITAFGAWVRPEVSRWDELPDFLAEDPEFSRDERVDNTGSFGVSVNMPGLTDWLSIYLEGDYQIRDELEASEHGQAAYATFDLSAGYSNLLLEGVMLEDFAVLGSGNSALNNNRFRYGQPPTLERIDQEVLNNEDVVGGRVRWEQWFPAPDITLHLNAMMRMNDRGEDAEIRQLHGYGGVERVYNAGASRISAAGGYRDEAQTRADTEGPFKQMKHIEFDWVQSIGAGYSSHITSNVELRTLAEADYIRGSTFVGVEKNGLGALTFELGYDTQNQQDSVANLFYAGIVKWEINDRFQLSATGGTQRGGLKCINGVCREYPGFAGGRIELVTRF